MDQEFSKKVKRKRIRLIAIVLIIVAAAAWIIYNTTFAKADYTKSLADEIKTAETLISDAEKNLGNEKDQYAPYTVEVFRTNLAGAKTVSDSEDSAYSDKQESYQNLKEQVKLFKDSKNKDVISEKEMAEIAKSGKDKEFNVDGGENLEIGYTVKANSVKTPAAVNLMASKSGPNNADINNSLKDVADKSDIISFYHDGDFGSTLSVTIPLFYSEAETTYVYKVSPDNGALALVSEAATDKKNKTATFDISSGGDYVMLTEKLSEDQQKQVEEKIAETRETAGDKSSESGSSASSGSSQSGSSDSNTGSGGSGGSQPAQPEKITVTLEVVNNVYPDKAYGTILSTTCTLDKGSSVYDALVKACRDNNVDMGSSYNPAYGTYYVEGIGGLYEKQGGDMSGWLYFVNGSSPSYGVSGYTLSGGEAISFRYTL